MDLQHNETFDLHDAIEPGTVPDGDHIATIVDAEVKSTQNGGRMVALKFELANGVNLFENYNVINQNPKAEQIGRGQLKSVARACGIEEEALKTVSTQQLCGKQLIVRTKMKFDDYSGRDRASVTSYKKLAENMAQSTDNIPNF